MPQDTLKTINAGATINGGTLNFQSNNFNKMLAASGLQVKPKDQEKKANPLILKSFSSVVDEISKYNS